LFATALFVALSIVAIKEFSFLPSLSEKARASLGQPPSSNMISATLMLYSFSAIVLILARMMSGAKPQGGFAHVGYLGAFFGFYHFAGSLYDNFWPVFAAGFTILALNWFHLRTYSHEEIRKTREGESEEEQEESNSGD